MVVTPLEITLIHYSSGLEKDDEDEVPRLSNDLDFWQPSTCRTD